MGTNGEQETTAGVSTTRKTFDIIEKVRDEEGLSITELTRRTGLTKSTVYRHVTTLSDLGYLIERNGGYYIGFRFLQLSETARTRKRGYTAAKRKVFELGQETDERAVFIVEEDFEGVYVHRYGSLSDTMIGKRRPLHSLASGKVILSEWEIERVETFIQERGLERITRNTITNPDDLFTELETIRERSYAINDEEHMNGLRGVAVPVYTPDDELLGSLGVFGPTSRFKGDYLREKLPKLLWDKAGEIRVTLAYG
ncbi:IclR family transcriptional regulator [Natrarchaeobaculum sulfurireducens]|uniref:DNA-binding transcriptional regulator, IclR family n=1 Tax=Natrarchaeobaculum sulfurireducens TaxID=2044521 RepID=A0A346PK02_9EURY|nr:IclR family transcriptional regulator [Natrarchaeobaculum sulfurireducens]AXR76253.1 IclR family transcriptional regulator [Natrarchaeobaculum sulfurireducens]AXR79847.1 DNA-binding transcriptional regulator, IclR family [Natrarchaeobaculum sulfurireducens]